MVYGVLALILITGFFVLYLVLFAPKPDLVFTSTSDEEVRTVKRYLEDNGVEVYTKGMDMQLLHETAHDLVTPSLHVLNPGDRSRALELVRAWETGFSHADMGPR